jgi:TetR/AcrR family acrAB operon transcriptional repressor
MARCTKEESLETRSRILDAAEDVFYEKGVAHTSLAEVAQAANVTRGAIYWHFKNKSDLFVAMCERVSLPMEAMVKASADEFASDPLGQLRSACIFILREAMLNAHSRKVLAIMFHKCEFVDAADPIQVRQQESFHNGTANIERILGNAVKKAQLPSTLDTRLAAVMFHASLSGLLNNWLFSPVEFDLAQDAEKLIDACMTTLHAADSLHDAQRNLQSTSTRSTSDATGRGSRPIAT